MVLSFDSQTDRKDPGLQEISRALSRIKGELAELLEVAENLPREDIADAIGDALEGIDDAIDMAADDTPEA